MPSSSSLHSHYPWITPHSPLISSAPMRLISTSHLVLSVSRAGGLGFLGIGTDILTLHSLLSITNTEIKNSPIVGTPPGVLPVGVGFICWGIDLNSACEILAQEELKPAALWLFAPRHPSDLASWTSSLRKATNNLSKIWIQVGSVADALQAARECSPDVLVIQGHDAGGHGLAKSCSIITLLPEATDTLTTAGFGNIPLIATGGIVDGRGVAASILLGAAGICMGTRFLGSNEAFISKGYRDAILHACDGGTSTGRTTVYDRIRGTHGWPVAYDGRGVLNDTHRDHHGGMREEENVKLYEEAVKAGDAGWGLKGKGARMTTYAGTGVGLVTELKPAGEIVKEVQTEARKLLGRGSRL